MRKELSKGPDQVVNAPLYLIFLVNNILLEEGAVGLFVRFKCVLSNLGCTIIIASVIDRYMNESASHSLLIDILKVFENLEKIGVVV